MSEYLLTGFLKKDTLKIEKHTMIVSKTVSDGTWDDGI